MENKTEFKETIVYSRSGMGLCGTTFIVFLILKLVGVIAWSWWWVTAPLWIPVALTFLSAMIFFAIVPLIVFIFGFIVMLIAMLGD